MRPPEELEAELVRTRRKLYRLSGVMTFVFIVCLIVVFAAVGGALVVVDKRAAQTLPAEANSTNTNQVASAPKAPALIAPVPARADAAPPTTVAAAPANSPSNPPQPTAPPTTVAAAPAAPPPPEPAPPAQVPTTTAAVSPVIKPTSPAPPPAGLTGAGVAPSTDIKRTDIKHMARTHPRHDDRSTVGAAPNDTAARSDDAREPPQAPAPSIDLKHTARTHPRHDERHDERSTVGAAPSDTAARSDDARDRRRTRAIADADDDVANGPPPQRVIVVRPSPRDEARTDDGDQPAPPRQHDFFGDLFGGIFGNRDQ